MKKIAIINSHVYSGSSQLYEAMCNHSFIQGYKRYRKENEYLNDMDLVNLGKLVHKKRNKSAIYLDEILKNQLLSTKLDFSKYLFIHIIRRPKETVNLMVRDKIDYNFAARHYAFRVRRICEVARKTPNCVLLTFDDLKSEKGLELVSDLLGIKEPINFKKETLSPIENHNNLISLDLEKTLDDCYERYFYFIKQQKNIITSDCLL
jgi:hypothetical protein